MMNPFCVKLMDKNYYIIYSDQVQVFRVCSSIDEFLALDVL